MDKYDCKKEEKSLYLPPTTPTIIDVPAMPFIMVDGKGDPNEPNGAYAAAIEALYALTFAIKMSKMSGNQPAGYFEYVVPPLEGLWWTEDPAHLDLTRKDTFLWTSMIRQPDFVTENVFIWACEQVHAKKPEIDISNARLAAYSEGVCVQCMHIGPYDTEPATVAQMESFAAQNGYLPDWSDGRFHHEIYISDPRKVAPEKCRTVLRHPIKPKP